MNPTFIYDAQYLKLDKQLHLYVREEWIKKHIREIKNSDCLTIKDAERLATRLSSREHPLLLWSAHFIKNMFLRMKRSRGENHIFKFLDFWEKYSLGERSILGFSNWEGLESANSYDFLNSLIGHLSIALIITKGYRCFEAKFGNSNKQVLSRKFSKLLSKEQWNLEKVLSLLEDINKTEATFEQIDKAVDMLLIININNLNPTDNAQNSIHLEISEVLKSDPEGWADKLREIWIEKAFTSPKETPVNEIIENVVKLNHNNEAISNYANERLITHIFAIKEYSTSIILESDDDIKDWSKSKIKKWSSIVKDNEFLSKSNGIKEAIAVISRANYLLTGYTPRFTQIITVLLMIKTGDNGLLMQVATGEGKSLIVSMLAVIKCLQGHTVDIVTSSPILAKRDAIEMKPFYEMFDITVADNEDRSGGVKA